MRIIVTAISKFQKYFPARTTELDFPGSTLADFISWVEAEYGLDVTAHRNIKITHNSVLIRDYNVSLAEGDRISFIPIVAGG
jgi:molybdopterin converting factor small subunit